MEKKKNNRGSLSYLLKEAWYDQKMLYLFFLLNIILMLITSMAGIMAPRFLIAELTGDAGVTGILIIAGSYFLLTAASGYLLPWVKGGYELRVAYIRYHFLEKTKEKVLRVSYKSLEDPKYLNNFWRVTSATSDIEFGVQGILIQLSVLSANAVTSFFYLSILGSLNLWIVLILIVNIYLVYFFRSAASRYEVETSKGQTPYNRRQRYLTNVMGNLAFGKDIRVYGLSNFLLEKLWSNYNPKQAIERDIQKHHFKADLAENLFSCIRDVIIYGYLISCVLGGRISIADFTMCFMTVATLTVTLEQVFEDVAFVKSDLFRIAEMKNFLALPNEDDSEKPVIPIPQADSYELAFCHVSFRYPGSDQNVYTDFNFTIKAGKKLAIVGINGAGKTTLVKLVTRLYEPTEGQILLNGIDIRHFPLQDYRKLLTAVFQDINLFAMSLKENITDTDLEVDEELFEAALHNAGLTSFLEQHKGTVLGDLPLTRYLYDNGVDVSGGEKQKIGIARALYKNGRILIFDEPTAALDAYAEYTLYHELAELSRGKTLLFISHRLASTRFCDEIALVDGGRVAELGTHEELMEKQGMYYHMFLTQKKYYTESVEIPLNEGEKGGESHEELSEKRAV